MLKNVKLTIKYICAVLTTGLIGGIIGAAFAHTINFVTGIREAHPFLIYFLPIGAIITVLIYSFLKVLELSTNSCLNAAKNDGLVSPRLTPAVFICSAITHLLGGSAGREGAALQLGAGLSSGVAKLFHIDKDYRRSLILCGMAAVFAAVFGTPFAAAIFVFEATKGFKTFIKNIPFVIISSLLGYLVSLGLFIKGEHFSLPTFNLTAIDFWRIILLAGLTGIISLCYCHSLKLSKKAFSFIHNRYLRGVIGALLIILLAFIIGNQDYNGAGMHIISNIFSGETPHIYAFALKLLLTAITIGAGFKGGEIVPAFFIGATFGAAIGNFLGVSQMLCAAIGMLILFAGSTKCPLATFIIAFELFGFNKPLIICLIPALLVGYTFSGKISLYNKKEFNFFKKDDKNGKEKQKTYR